jgi:hypothetical protein
MVRTSKNMFTYRLLYMERNYITVVTRMYHGGKEHASTDCTMEILEDHNVINKRLTFQKREYKSK